LLFLACGPSDQRAPSSSGENVSKQSSALTASTSLEQALSGKIQPIVGAPGNLISASTAGEPSVGDDGSASYRIPIWVPSGINGLQPSLAVEYNSESPVGLLGPRWRLSGLSVITHCAKVRAIDTVQTAVKFDDDIFCLDGQRLLRQPGTDVFRPERDTYAKIVGTRDGNGDFVSFKAFRRDGLIYHYGRTLASRLHGMPRAFSGGPQRRTVYYAFYLDKIEDRYENSILITYGNAILSPNIQSDVEELVPSTITWGSTGDSVGQRSVSFSYDYLPTSQRRYVSGLGIDSREYLKTLTVSGPNGLGSTPILKRYKFTYDTKAFPNGPTIITGDRVLSSISECDPNDVCKKPTTIEWEPGSLDYTGVSLGASDANLTGYGSAEYGYDYSESYARVLATDVDGDGRDDVIYRAFNAPHHAGYFDCLGWKKRLTVVALDDATGIPSLGNPSDLTGGSVGSTAMPIGANQDNSCEPFVIPEDWYTHGWPPGNAYAGDLILTDLDGDGLADFLVPLGRGLGQAAPRFASYRAYLNKGTSVDPPINFLDSRGETIPWATMTWPVKSAIVAVGDIDGDGLPDILRPTENPPFHLAAASVASPSGLTGYTTYLANNQGWPFGYSECTAPAQCNKAIPDATWSNGTTAIRDLATVDLDGDGTAEIIRSAPSAMACLAGFCVGYDGLVSIRSPTMNGTTRMVPSTAGGAGSTRWFADLNGDGLPDLVWVDPAAPDRMWTSMNSGQGFVEFNSVSLPAGVEIAGAGAKDGGVRVVDFNQDGRQDLLLVGYTSSMPVLLSGGDGTSFTVHHTGVSNSGPSSPFVTHTLVADMNADGLPDIVKLQFQGLVGFIRQGKAPLMVTSVTEGTGRKALFSYEVALDRPTSAQPFYVSSPNLTCNEDKKRLECLKRGRWLTKSLTIGGADIPFPTTQTFSYEGGVSDKNGRGFLGFTKREIHGPGSRHTVITYEPTERLFAGARYVYPRALLPKTVQTDVDTWQGNASHHYTTETNTYAASFRGDGTYAVAPSRTERSSYHCASYFGGTCTGPGFRLGSQEETFVFDSFGNLTNHDITYKNGAGTVLEANTETTFFDPKPDTWLVTLHDASRNSTRTSTAGGETKTRTTRIYPDTVHGGIDAVDIEPGGGTTRLNRWFWRDPRGRLSGVLDVDVFAGVSRWTATYTYEDADGVDVASVYNALGQMTRFWRHPGLGLVVEVDHPDGLAETRSYDTFGRLLNETKTTGAYENFVYQDGPGWGSDVRVSPSGLNFRDIHLDSYGRETRMQVAVDANRSLVDTKSYDSMGHVVARFLTSGPPSNPTTTINTYNLTYDDLGRLQSDCHLTLNGDSACTTNSYEGLTVTSTDEAGRWIRHTVDAMGRPLQQSSVVRGATSSATFWYGPFGVLSKEEAFDQSGKTEIAYDVLGRQVSVSRTGVGTRGIKYNAFGDVVETYKQKSDLTKVDSVFYGRDLLGRVTSMSGSGIQRSFYWDVPAVYPGGTNPLEIGKLVDVIDEGQQTQIHYEVGSNGLLAQKTWTASILGPTELGRITFGYDSIGRLSTLGYPSLLGEGLTIRYGYFGFNGAVSSISNAATGAGIWAAQAWNERGQFTAEAMEMPGGPSITKGTSYDLSTGLPTGLDMVGTNGFASYTYAYDSAGLPRTFRSAGSVSGTWSSSLTYDNLSRLESWVPAMGAPTVSYTYDSDGNLTQRAWSGETVNYGTTANARTVSVVRGGVTVGNDSYRFDQWGRVFDTPAVYIAYDALDSVTSVTEKATGRNDMFRVDGFGKKLYAWFGNPFDGQPFRERWELDDLYEFTSGNSESPAERYHLRANGKLIADIVHTYMAPLTASFYLTDPVGSVLTEASSTTGALTARARRDPFGNALPNPTSPFLPNDPTGTDPDGSSRMAYAGHPREAGFGLIDMNARYYSPRLARFISPDSVIARPFDRRDHNAFAYAWNNPIANADPSGHFVVFELLSRLLTPNYTATDGSTLPHSLQNTSAGYDTGQGNIASSGCMTSIWGCAPSGPGYVRQSSPPPAPPPPPNPVVRRADNVAVASGESGNGAKPINFDLRNSNWTKLKVIGGESSYGSQYGIKVTATAAFWVIGATESYTFVTDTNGNQDVRTDAALRLGFMRPQLSIRPEVITIPRLIDTTHRYHPLDASDAVVDTRFGAGFAGTNITLDSNGLESIRVQDTGNGIRLTGARDGEGRMGPQFQVKGSSGDGGYVEFKLRETSLIYDHVDYTPLLRDLSSPEAWFNGL
jgi:RHS repeat-associated protein